MQCSYCGAGIAENELFCGECGAPRPETPRPPQPVQSPAVDAPPRPAETFVKNSPSKVNQSEPVTTQGKPASKSRRAWVWALLALALVCLCCVSLLAVENPLRNWLILWMVDQGWGHIEGSSSSFEMARMGFYGILLAGFQESHATRQAWVIGLPHTY